MTDVDAEHIASDACHGGIISVGHVTRIKDAKSMKAANEILFDHLLAQATQSSLKILCSFMTSAQGYPRMSEFGQMLHDKVSSNLW